jgi:hypothetical protein
MSKLAEALRDALLFIEELPADLGRGSLNGLRARMPHRIRFALAEHDAAPVVSMRPMEAEDGRKGWYIDHPDFYCDIEPDELTGKWAVFFRDKQGREGYAEHDAAPQQPFFEPKDAEWHDAATPAQPGWDTWEIPEWAKRDDLGGAVPSEVRIALHDAYVAGLRAAPQAAQPVALTDKRIDEIFDAHQDAPTRTFRYHVARAILAAGKQP